MLSRQLDFTVRRTEGRAETTRVLSSSSLRKSRYFRLMPFGMAENVNAWR